MDSNKLMALTQRLLDILSIYVLVPKLCLGMPSCNAPRCEWRLGTKKKMGYSTRSVEEGIPKRSLGTRDTKTV
ncbi:MAG: hypothetical protein KAI83_08535 [Thiomargarita sp.]|nr:hypothetical protein [Thiomargarita sp.]